jgi:hypothetical protein
MLRAVRTSMSKYKYSSLRLRLVSIASSTLLVVGITMGTTGIAHAQVEIGSEMEDGYSLCMNRYQGGTGSGTKIISYNCSLTNADNDFFSESIGRCGGQVTSTCPYTVGSGMNADNEGDYIYQFEAINWSNGATQGCLGDNGDGQAALLGCNSQGSGSGGGYGTVFVAGTGYQGEEWTTPEYGWSSPYESDGAYAAGYSNYLEGLQDPGYKGQLLLNTPFAGNFGASMNWYLDCNNVCP